MSGGINQPIRDDDDPVIFTEKVSPFIPVVDRLKQLTFAIQRFDVPRRDAPPQTGLPMYRFGVRDAEGGSFVSQFTFDDGRRACFGCDGHNF